MLPPRRVNLLASAARPGRADPLGGGGLERPVDGRSNIAAHDTLFVELAARERKHVVTFDAKLLAAFPNVAVRPSTVVAS
jgi:predicted nucleic acid-binding protein